MRSALRGPTPGRRRSSRESSRKRLGIINRPHFAGLIGREERHLILGHVILATAATLDPLDVKIEGGIGNAGDAGPGKLFKGLVPLFLAIVDDARQK